MSLIQQQRTTDENCISLLANFPEIFSNKIQKLLSTSSQ